MGKFNGTKGVVSDLDGVFYDGPNFHTGGKKLIDAIRNRGWKITFASNGAGGRDAAVNKFKGAGVEISAADVMTAGHAMALRLRDDQKKFADQFRTLFLGPPELKEECRHQGVERVDDFLGKNDVWDAEKRMWIGKQVPSHVVVSRHEFDNATLEAAAAAISRGSRWLSTGIDHAVTTGTGDMRVGTGVLVSSIQRLLSSNDEYSNLEPEIMGKPHPRIVEACLAHMNIPPELAIMLGDSLETDMTVAECLEMTRVLVKSGVTGPKLAAQNTERYDHIYNDIGEFADAIASEK